MTSDRLTSMMGGMVPYPRDSSRPSSVFSKEDDGHRLGRPARRGVGVVGFVPAPTRLSIPELDWLMRVRDGAGRSVRVPEHRYSLSDLDEVE